MDIPVIASFIIFFLFIFVVVKISEPRGGSGEPVKEQADENGEEILDEYSFSRGVMRLKRGSAKIFNTESS